jgi:MFS family permease
MPRMGGISGEEIVDQSTTPPSWLTARGLIPERGPKRTLAVATFVNQIGNGLFMTAGALFYTRSVGLSVESVGLGMGIAAVIGLFAGVPMGHIADRRGPREIYIITLTVQALAMAALVLVSSFALFVVVVCLIQLASAASQAARGPLIRGFGGAKTTKFRAYLRALNNLAGSCGAIFAGVAVQVDTRAAYVALVLANALTFIASAAVIIKLPKLAPVPVPAHESRRTALKDVPFVLVTALDGLMSIQYQVLIFAVPLWIVTHTTAPRWLVGACVVINTAMVVLLQVKASKGVDTNEGATRAIRRAGFAFVVGMGLISVTGILPGWLAVVVLAVGVAAHTIGELWHASASFELSFGLAPSHAQGQYSGLFALGHGVSNAVAPAVLGLFCITWGMPGWWVLAGCFVLIGFAMTYVVRWAEKTRPAEDVEPANAA